MLKKIIAPFLYFLLILILCSCMTIFSRQGGIQGHVYLIKGNQMPSPDIKPAPPKGLATTIYIYELTNISQVKQGSRASFYSTINAKLVTTVGSDENGSFKTSLAPGMYSLFIKKDDLFYANIFDDKQNIAPVEVKKGSFTNVDIRADYDAVY